MNKYTLGTIIGTALLGFAKAKRGGRNWYKPRNIEDIYSLSPQEKAKITKLDLNWKDINHLPDDIFDGFTNLRELVLDSNKLTELPQSIGNLTNLRTLELFNNQLTGLPDSIGNLTNLQTLNLAENQLTELPDSIGNLTNLGQLYLGSNQLEDLPQSIGNLTNLRELELEGNDLTEIPQSIGNLTNLTWLGLYVNQLTELPESFVNLTNLKYLNWDRNNWKKPVPKETILKMIRNRMKPSAIEAIIDMNNSIPTETKSNLRLR